MKYYIIWIEGLSWQRGEKIKTLTDDDHTYTTLITESLRVKPTHRKVVSNRLIDQGVVPSFITFIPTSYAPAGTIWNP